MLRTLREFAGDFQAVTLTQGGLTIAVTFNGQRPVEAPARRRQVQDEKKPNALEILTRTPPVFDFDVS